MKIALACAAALFVAASADAAQMCKFYNHHDDAWHSIPCRQAADILSNIMTPDDDSLVERFGHVEEAVKQMCLKPSPVKACDAFMAPAVPK